jgi:hypothetical protein
LPRSVLIQTDLDNIKNVITAWITAHSTDADTVRANAQVVRNQVQSHQLMIKQILAQYKAGTITKDAMRLSLKEQAKLIADELKIGLRPTNTTGTGTHMQLASSLVPLKKKLRDDIIAETLARIHRS